MASWLHMGANSESGALPWADIQPLIIKPSRIIWIRVSARSTPYAPLHELARSFLGFWTVCRRSVLANSMFDVRCSSLRVHLLRGGRPSGVRFRPRLRRSIRRAEGERRGLVFRSRGLRLSPIVIFDFELAIVSSNAYSTELRCRALSRIARSFASRA